MRSKKMQAVSFRNVDEFFDFLPADEHKIARLLQQIVFDCLPHVTEHLAYNVPYYRIRKNICFIWPASVTWGKKQTYEGVRFGFTCGYLLEDETGWLDKGDRKQVYWKDFTDPREIDTEVLKAYIFEAALVDEQGLLK